MHRPRIGSDYVSFPPIRGYPTRPTGKLRSMNDGSARRRRLDPEVFRLPVEKIRSGWYSDAYFNFAKELLEAEGRHAHVTMQVFQKHHAALGGIDEAIALLKQIGRASCRERV